ncbi:MAG: arabinose-5-phosphate isomerase [Cellvibrionaceae bacterium]|jgi:arabinose-5-phosphate isomerase
MNFASIDKQTLIEAGKRTVRMEMAAIAQISDRIDDNFVRACEIILNCRGRTIVTGMGKSGHIGNKIAATLASTGTPSFFVHPGEASHGDLGMITRNDVVIAISNSGNSPEIVVLLPLLKRLNIPLIAMSSKAETPSSLARQATVNLDISVESEACPLDLSPTSSTSVTLVMGDALAVALLEARGFTAEDFAFTHPGGVLGRRLLLKVSDLMHKQQELPKVLAHTPVKQALAEMTAKGFGITTVLDESNHLVGVFTDGDLRRIIEKKINIDQAQIEEVMNKNPHSVTHGVLAAEALGVMEQQCITALVIVNDQQQPVGVLHMHDLLRAGIL